VEAIAGSNLYNLNTPSSDIDIRGVYQNTYEEQFSLLPVADDYSDDKSDIKYYSLHKFFKLAADCNPNIIELLYLPEDKILYKNNVYDITKDNASLFMSKKAKHTFLGYAHSQIQRAKGKNKKANNIDEYIDDNTIAYYINDIYNSADVDKSKEKVQRDFGKNFIKYLEKVKDSFEYDMNKIDVSTIKRRPRPEDFCWILEYCDYPTMQYPSSIETYQLSDLSKYCCSSIEHFPNMYKLFRNGTGVFKDNQLVVSFISKEKEYKDFDYLFTFNQDAYQRAIKEYDSLMEWLVNRNEARYTNDWDTGDVYDRKNMMHTMRLLMSAENIALTGKPLITFDDKSDDRKFLFGIRNGEYSYEYLLEYSEVLMDKLEVLFKESSLPEKADIKKINELYLNICRNIL
jgi:predicted nucleotidyltransferase